MKLRLTLFLSLGVFGVSCTAAEAAAKSEISRFIETVLGNPDGRSPYASCVRSLDQARFVGEGYRFARRTKGQEAFTVRSWHSRTIHKNSPRKLWVRLTAFGFFDENKVAANERYFLNNLEAIQFGFVSDDFDFEGALRETQVASGNPTAWKNHVGAMRDELERALKPLKLNARVVVAKNGLGTAPLERLNIGFQNGEDKEKWSGVFSSFRGVPVVSLLNGRRARQQEAPLIDYAHDPEEGAWVEESPKANLHRLSGTVLTSIARLLESPAARPGWSARYEIFVKVADDEAASNYGLSVKGFSKHSYRANWSLENIAAATLDPRIVLITPKTH